MAEKKRNVLGVLLFAIMFLVAGLLFGCGGPTETIISSSGGGTVVESQNDDGQKVYTAKAKKWNDFLGWYDGQSLFSKELVLTLEGGEPENLTAIFGTNAEHSINRFMQASFNKLDSEKKGDYLNFSSSAIAHVKNENKDEQYTLQIAGSLAVTGQEHIVKFDLQSQDNIEKISAILKNNAEKTLFYVKNGENEYNYQLPIAFQQIRVPDEYTSLSNLLGQENYAQLQPILDYNNQLSLFENVVNSENQTKATIRIDKLLDFIKNVVLPNVAESDVWLKEFLETLTKKYQGLGREIPSMSATITVDYSSSADKEVFADIKATASIEEEYKLELGETVTIPKTDIAFDMTSFNFSFGQNATTEGEIDQTLEKIEVLNTTLEGEIEFLHEDSATLDKTVIDTYDISLKTDINPFAVQQAFSADSIDWEKIDWSNFGYFNLRMSLVEKDGTEADARHNGATDYINILIDSDTFGENMLVYGALYNPQMSAVCENYIVNNSFYLPKVMAIYGDALADSFPTPTEMDLNLLVDALKNTLSFVINNDQANLNDIVYKFLEGIMASSNENVEILKESFYFEDEKIILATDQVKSIISDAMQSFSEWLEYADFTSNILGSATHLSFNFSTLEYGKVDSATKKADLDYYNEKHKTLTALAEEAEIVGVDDATFDSDFKAQLDSIKGNKITVKGIFSDGSEAEKIDDYKSTNQPIKLTIWGYDVIEESDGSAKIRLYLTYAEGTYASTLYSKGIPYGIIACDREIAIA